MLRVRYSEPFAKIFEQDVANEGGQHRNLEIGDGEDVFDRPDEPSRPSHAGTLKLPHQQIGIEQEDDESYFDESPPTILFHEWKGPIQWRHSPLLLG